MTTARLSPTAHAPPAAEAEAEADPAAATAAPAATGGPPRPLPTDPGVPRGRAAKSTPQAGFVPYADLSAAIHMLVARTLKAQSAAPAAAPSRRGGRTAAAPAASGSRRLATFDAFESSSDSDSEADSEAAPRGFAAVRSVIVASRRLPAPAPATAPATATATATATVVAVAADAEAVREQTPQLRFRASLEHLVIPSALGHLDWEDDEDADVDVDVDAGDTDATRDPSAEALWPFRPEALLRGLSGVSVGDL
ncbi:hypothetical protein CXG81DRAFT_24158 [Caulochytrium protostelioides]|uniref:Uncharacterized protein n=1 Tax=Caulochytrium protostelioides TaxID=1555241 RepID=A0A4P9XCH4_9FUNG|nr:hypothetical protein CXG81DRAFT_24158 [Caulochytrium protostelioides]|eukprot:RKP03157.1 hypothetical protein CXG81DRAFT_24158 [Caulochytrium protostelioides]